MARLIERVDAPKDMRRLSIDQLPQLAQEVRDEVISVVSEVGRTIRAAKRCLAASVKAGTRPSCGSTTIEVRFSPLTTVYDVPASSQKLL